MKKKNFYFYIFVFVCLFVFNMSFVYAKYTVRFFPNGGYLTYTEGSSDNCGYSDSAFTAGISGEKYALTNCFQREGYEFVGWVADMGSGNRWVCYDGIYRSNCNFVQETHEVEVDESSNDSESSSDSESSDSDGDPEVAHPEEDPKPIEKTEEAEVERYMIYSSTNEREYQTGKNGSNVGYHAVWKNIKTGELVYPSYIGKTYRYYEAKYYDKDTYLSGQGMIIGDDNQLLHYTSSDNAIDGWTAKVLGLNSWDDRFVCEDGSYEKSCVKYKIYKYRSTETAKSGGKVLFYVHRDKNADVPLEPATSCVEYSASDCPYNCTANDEYKFCSPNGLTYLKCGDVYDFPQIVPNLTSYAVTLLKTVAPIILIIVSIIQLIKGIVASKEDEIKKAQGSLIKKVIIAAIIFFVVTIVQFVMLKVTSSDTEKGNLSSCLSCFLNGTDKCGSIYYKDGYGKCYYVNGGSTFECE